MMHVKMSIRTRKLAICGLIAFLTILYLCTRSRTHVYVDSRHDKQVSLKSLLLVSIKAAKLGGAEVVNVHDQAKFGIESKGKTKEGVNDPVTEADYRSHCAMYQFLTKAFPQITVISEEVSKDCDRVVVQNLARITGNDIPEHIRDIFVNPDSVTVWIDPLDATKEFTENLLQYVTTMVCVAINGVPMMGVIYKPFETKENSSLFWALVNEGQSENLVNLPRQPQDGKQTIIVSRSHAGEVRNISKIAFGENVEIISAAGAGYKFLELASANASAYIHTTMIKKWDICAGTAILTAIGGQVQQLRGAGSIGFDQSDSTVLTTGLLATMKDHAWYLDRILGSSMNKVPGLPFFNV